MLIAVCVGLLRKEYVLKLIKSGKNENSKERDNVNGGRVEWKARGGGHSLRWGEREMNE